MGLSSFELRSARPCSCPRSHATLEATAKGGHRKERRLLPDRKHLSVTHEGGTRFRILVRGHELVVDQPVAAGGKDTAPTPTELFVASIAACAAFYGRTFLARRGLPDRVDVAAGWEVASKPDRVGRVSLVVTAPGVPPNRMVALERVIEHCLVHETLKSGCEVRVDVQAGLREDSSVAAMGLPRV